MRVRAADDENDARIVLVGAGLIGRRHAEAIARARRARLAAVVDPAPVAREVAEAHGAVWFEALDDALAAGVFDAAILATPSALHADGALATIAAGLPTLVEKPIATAVSDARRAVKAAERAGVPLATGHHRRHNPILWHARARIAQGALGSVVAAHATAWLPKPDGYFAPDWRRRPGAGPLLTNLIHDIDALHFLLGPIESVSAHVSGAARSHAVEDTAVASVRFQSGALGTLTVSDAAVAPWSWELTARENPAYPATGESCLWVAGTGGALSIPDGRVWTQARRDWWTPIAATQELVPHADPLVAQVENLAAVARAEAHPIASGHDGLLALAVVEAIERSAASGATIAVADLAAAD